MNRWLLTVAVVAFSGCMGEDGLTGRDGEDGDIYIALSWVGTLSAGVSSVEGLPSGASSAGVLSSGIGVLST